jgi:hypothetical protein
MRFRGIFEHPVVLPFVLAFVLLNLAVTEYGGTNAKSRNAALRAMSESHTFAITRYQDWTIDWSQTPDGAVYSNKAPGPMLLGFPLYWGLDQIFKITDHGWQDELGRRREPTYWFHLIFIFCLQVIPFGFLAGASATFLANRGASSVAVSLALLTMLFGNTASMFMNSNFGHGFAAVLVLGLGLALVTEHFFMAGLLCGFAVLSDYGVIAQLPAIALALVVVLWKKPRAEIFSALSRFCFGAVPGAILWCWYHWTSFGSVFALPNKFQNPNFIDMKEVKYNLWGVIGLPNPAILYELLFGPSRGLLYTQPYTLLLPFLFFWQRPLVKERTEIFFWIFGLGGLFCLLFMNAGFGGWHGGHTPGPRYLSAIFPVIALLLGLVYDRLQKPLRWLLWGAVLVALALRALVYAHGVMVPQYPIWPFLYEHLMNTQRSTTPVVRVAIFSVVLGLATIWSVRRSRKFYSLMGSKDV